MLKVLPEHSKEANMNPRVQKHRASVTSVARLLREHGLEVQVMPPRTGYDLLVNKTVRIGVRVSQAGDHIHNVNVGGKTYCYEYTNFSFNFHRHGRIVKECDFFVCLGMMGKKLHTCLVIPRSSVTGPTLSLHLGKRAYHGHYVEFENNWQLIADAAA